MSEILSSALFTTVLQIQNENNFLPTSKHRQTKVRPFLGICLYVASFIAQISSTRCHKTRRHLSSGRETANSQTFRVTGSNQNAQKLLFTDLVNNKTKYGFNKRNL